MNKYDHKINDIDCGCNPLWIMLASVIFSMIF